MAHPYHHAVRSARLFGGRPEDYLAIHVWFDESKLILPTFGTALFDITARVFFCVHRFLDPPYRTVRVNSSRKLASSTSPMIWVGSRRRKIGSSILNRNRGWVAPLFALRQTRQQQK